MPVRILLISLSLLYVSPALCKEVGLKESLRIVNDHPQSHIQRLKVEFAGREKTGAWLNLGPKFYISRSWDSKQEINKLDNSSYSLNTKLNIFRGFRDYSNIKSKNYNLNAAQANLEDEINDTELTVSEVFLRCVYSQRAFTEAQMASQLRKQAEQIAEIRFNKGISSEDEYIRLKIDAESEQADVLRKQQNMVECYKELEFWIGKFDSLTPPQKQIPDPDNDQEWKFIISPSDETHPEIQSLVHLVDKARWDKNSARLTYFPTLDFTYTEVPHASFQANSKLWLLTLTWTPFDSGQKWTNLQLSNIRYKDSEMKLRQERLEVKKIQQQRLSELAAQSRQYKIFELNHRRAEKIYKTSLKRFRSGAINANDVAQDQTRVIKTATDLNLSWLNKYLAWLRLQNSYGRRISSQL